MAREGESCGWNAVEYAGFEEGGVEKPETRDQKSEIRDQRSETKEEEWRLVEVTLGSGSFCLGWREWEEERGNRCLALSIHWHSRETRQPHIKKSLSVSGLFDSLAQPRDASATCEEELYQLRGFFGSLAQPRDASATFEEGLISCWGFAFQGHSRETRQPHLKKSAVSVAGVLRFRGTAARSVSHIGDKDFRRSPQKPAEARRGNGGSKGFRDIARSLPERA